MTEGPWLKTIFGNEALFTTEGGKYVAILTTKLGPDGRNWIMDQEDLQLMLTSPMLREGLKESTSLLMRLLSRYATRYTVEEAGQLDITIQHNERLIVESLEGNNNG